MNRNKWLVVAVGLLISVVFLWLSFRNLQPEQVWASIRQSNVAYLALGAVWYFTAVSIIALRWHFLLRAIQQIALRALIPLVCIGYAGNNIYPFRSGELLRILLLQRNHGVPFARGTTTVVVERVFDGIVMLTFILVSLLISGVPSPEVHMVATVAAPIFLTALAVFFVLAARPNLLRRLYGLISRVLPDRLVTLLSGVIEDVIDGLDALRSPVDLVGTILSSYASWALEASVYWIVSHAFGLETSYITMLLVVGVVNLAGLIPASPGQFGAFESFASAALISAGIPPVLAVAFALTVHMVIWLPVTLVGLFFLLQQGLSVSSITQPKQLENNLAG